MHVGGCGVPARKESHEYGWLVAKLLSMKVLVGPHKRVSWACGQCVPPYGMCIFLQTGGAAALSRLGVVVHGRKGALHGA